MIEKEMVYSCPAYKCGTISKEPGVCTKHGIKMVRSLVKKSSILSMTKFWVMGIKPLKKKKSSLKELI